MALFCSFVACSFAQGMPYRDHGICSATKITQDAVPSLYIKFGQWVLLNTKVDSNQIKNCHFFLNEVLWCNIIRRAIIASIKYSSAKQKIDSMNLSSGQKGGDVLKMWNSRHECMNDLLPNRHATSIPLLMGPRDNNAVRRCPLDGQWGGRTGREDR